VLAWRLLRAHRLQRVPAAVMLQRRVRARGRAALGACSASVAAPLATVKLRAPPEVDGHSASTTGQPASDSYWGSFLGFGTLLDRVFEFASADTSASCRHAVELGNGLTAFDDV
jgi:hypothetical protein